MTDQTKPAAAGEYPPHTWRGAMQVLGIAEARACCLRDLFNQDQQNELVGLMGQPDRQQLMREYIGEVEADKKTATE